MKQTHVRRLEVLRWQLVSGDNEGQSGIKSIPKKRPPPADHQIVARQLGVNYGPTTLVQDVPWIKVGGEDTPAKAVQLIQKISIRPTDVWIATYPKCGTTWMHQVALLLLNDGDPSAWGSDPHGFKSKQAGLASWPELQYLALGDDFLETLKNVPNPRVMKTHAPIQLLPGSSEAEMGGAEITMKSKAIYVTRNPKDACVSMLYHAQTSFGFDGDWDQWYTLWMSGEVEFGSWFQHTLGWWKAHQAPQNKGRILWVTYEGLSTDRDSTIARVAEFLDVQLTEELLAKVTAASDFGTMQKEAKARDRNSTFFRKGEIGDWRNHFTTAQSEEFDTIYCQKMEGMGLHFDFGGGLVM